MRSMIGTLVLLAAVAAAGVQAKEKEYLYVENTKGGDITIISIPEHKVVGSISADKVGGHPDDVIASRDGSTIYVNRVDNEDVLVIDTSTSRVLFSVPVTGIPHHMTLSKDEKHLYVPIFNYPRLDVIDLEKRQVIKSIPVGWGAHGTRLSRKGDKLFVGHIFHEAIYVIDTASLEVVRKLKFPDGVRPFELSADESEIYVQLSNLHGFVSMDLDSGKITRTINLPEVEPNQLAVPFPFTVNHGMAISRDGKLLLTAGSITNNVVAYSLPDFKRLAEIEVGAEPNWIIFNNDEKYAYVTNRVDDTLSVISTKTLKEIKRVKVGDYPQRMDTAVVPNPEFDR